jgi:hypothetical protein
VAGARFNTAGHQLLWKKELLAPAHVAEKSFFTEK